MVKFFRIWMLVILVLSSLESFEAQNRNKFIWLFLSAGALFILSFVGGL